MHIDWNIPHYFAKNYDVMLFIVFPILLPDRSIYMKHNLTRHNDGYLVIVDTSKFISTWRYSTDDDRFCGYHLGDKELWKSDYKYPFTEECFLLGKSDPVPIPTKIVYQPKLCSNREISFGNDFTRTIWLLANDAPYFPVVVSDHDESFAFWKDMGKENCSTYPLSYIFTQAKNSVGNIPYILG